MSIENEWLRIEPTDDTIENWAMRRHISEETKQNVLQANVLFVPNDGYLEEDILYFPAGTSELFHFFVNSNKDEDLHIEACIEDDDHVELSLHADLLIIAGLIVTNLVAPVVVSLISDYIKDWLRERREGGTVKATLTIVYEEDKRSLKYLYDGPADEYHTQMLNAISKSNELPNKETLQLPQPEHKKQGRKKQKRKKRKR